MDAAVKVILRIRPHLAKETRLDEPEPLTAQSDTLVTVAVPQKDQVDGGRRAEQRLLDTEFDRVYGPEATQAAIFGESVVPLVHALLDGINCTVLAYGQTGSGKSYSMGTLSDRVSGPQDTVQAGILPRALQYLYDTLSQRADTAQHDLRSYTIGASFIELYNEDFYDLLAAPAAAAGDRRERTANIQVREDPTGALYVTGAEETLCSTVAEALGCLGRGRAWRATGATAMNETSSRSHAIFTLHVQQTLSRDAPGAGSVLQLSSKFHFVDLAGSERLKRTLSTGSRATEGIAINQGLHVLGKVIAALSERSDSVAVEPTSPARRVHIPYRDSKLTRLLQDSVGGNSRTVMLACVSPSETDLFETISTLQYASKARKIRNQIRVNVRAKGAAVDVNRHLLQQISDLRAQLEAATANPRREGQRLAGYALAAQKLAQEHERRTLALLAAAAAERSDLAELCASVSRCA